MSIINQIKDYARQFAHRDEFLFRSALGLCQAIITESNNDSLIRWELHQQCSEIFSEFRAKALGTPIVRGFFYKGMAAEHSLFSGYPESVDERFCLQCSEYLPELIIGYGCQEFEEKLCLRQEVIDGEITPIFDTSQFQDWGWEDGYGAHVEYYVPNKKSGSPYLGEYRRSSMSCRTLYSLFINSDYSVEIYNPTIHNV